MKYKNQMNLNDEKLCKYINVLYSRIYILKIYVFVRFFIFFLFDILITAFNINDIIFLYFFFYENSIIRKLYLKTRPCVLSLFSCQLTHSDYIY